MESIAKKFKRKRPTLTEYIIYANDPEGNKPFKYPTNEMSTTKYTILSFPVRFLYEQFRRLPNLYFLVVAIIACVPSISPISPVSAVLPFLLIILTAAVKEAFEDFKRWQSDREINSRTYEILNNDGFIQTENKDIMVGNIIHLVENEEVPADLVLISTSEKDGVCYVDTANLDGETNLKLFKSLPKTGSYSEVQVVKLKAKIRCQPPNEKLYDFNANMIIEPTGNVLDNPLTPVNDEDLLSLGKSQLLMRGVRIRNTKHVYGIVVYTGKNTKLALNAVHPPSKFSQTDRTINYVSLGIFGVYIAIVSACAIASNVLEADDPTWYNPLATSLAWDGGIVFMAYFVLLGYFIPISLFVNLEILKLIQAGWMIADEDMVIDSKGMRVKNSNLNDELSRISYIFSDKTGTLTQNKMLFDQCSIDGIKYSAAGRGELKDMVDRTPMVREFLLNMALNNEALPEDKGDNVMPKYAAPSPDEIALVKGAYINGVQFRRRANEGITIYFEKSDEAIIYEVLGVFEFTSERKRSSVIVRTPHDEYIMYTKGADSVMKNRVSSKTSVLSTTVDHLTEYSKEGLRALIFARKELSPNDYKDFKHKYQAAASSLDDREGKIGKLMDEMEQDLELIGCSAIQDALQDRVPFTIDYFIRAGIKVWMITGDQQDTAENIGYSCKLIKRNSELVRVVKCDNSDKCGDDLLQAQKIVISKPKVSMVIDGQSLVYALSAHSELFLSVGKECETVIVCRADPLQKALVVRLMKNGTKKICLSVGDGANDVSMLQEAHIGVGIWGEEGSQAANNADYSIRMFKHLAKLITVHGRYSMLRTAIMVEYSFYKNLALFLCQFWFAFFCKFSAQTYFDDWVMSAYNVVIVSLPPLSLGVFEKDLHEKVIMKYPETYRELQQGLYFTPKTFCKWMITSLYHSIFIFFSIFFVSDIMSPSGIAEDLLVFSNITVSAGVFAIVCKAAVSTKHWVWPSVVCYLLSLIALFGLLLIENTLVTLFPSFYNVMVTAMELPYFWLMILFMVVLCTVPEISFEYSQRMFFPYDWQIVQEQFIDVKEDNYVDEDYAEIEMKDKASYFPEDDLEKKNILKLSPRVQEESSPSKIVGEFSSNKGKNHDGRRMELKVSKFPLSEDESESRKTIVELSPRVQEEEESRSTKVVLDKAKGEFSSSNKGKSHDGRREEWKEEEED